METCRNLHEDCQCDCPLELLKKFGRPETSNASPAGADESSFCAQKCMQEQGLLLMNTSVCPFACYKTTYQKHNQFVFEDQTPMNSVKLMLMQSDAIETRVEEELYGLAKLFSEIGGLSSFFFGFSCLIIFDLLEALRAEAKTKKPSFRQRWPPLQPRAYFPGIPYRPHCLPLGDDSPLTALQRKPILALDEASKAAYFKVDLNVLELTSREPASPKCQDNTQQDYFFCATWVLEDFELVPAFVEIKI
ncbi:unnamed protein product [Dibothriocephalus latus]|uniref:Amiloride-sensitive sodium channel n=1 Tax=Dibothriocephalus latus TaxID=60516 RepID=A0A3P6U0W2_DIBLA|nr:unnamed protein product [Dibothriocephalus latus]